MNKLAFAMMMGFGVTACGSSVSTEDQARVTKIEALTPNLEDGKALYTKTCTSCHGTDGKSGSENKNTPETARNNKEELIDNVLNGKDSMPAYKTEFTDQDISNLLGYVASL